MTEQDCRQIYQEFVSMMQDFQLGWVIEEVELLRLIEATERIVVDTIDMEGELANFLIAQGERLHSPVKLGFVADANTATVATTIDVSPDRRQAATELRQFLQALRQTVMAGVD